MSSPRRPAITLIILGLLLTFHATLLRGIHQTTSFSNGMQFQSDLNHWVMEKIREGKLTEADRREIFDESYLLQLSGEGPPGTFNDMIRHIAGRGSYLLWPGLLAILMGASSLYYRTPAALDSPARKT